MRIAAASLNQTPLDFVGNADRIRDAMAVAVERCADVLVLPPEAVLGPEAMRHRESRAVRDRALHITADLEAASPIPLVFSEAQRVDIGGQTIFTQPTAIPFLLGRPKVAPSIADAVVVVAAPLGCPAGRFVYDGVSSIKFRGRCLAQSRPFSFAPLEVIVADLGASHVSVEPLDDVDLSDESILFDTLARAIALGLFDYRRKSGAERFVLSLSGGADSTAVALLVHLSVLLAKDANQDSEICTRDLLTCLYQATENSSATTRAAARGVAAMIGATYHETDVQPMVDLYRRAASIAVGRELTWERDAVSLQNIQARARSPLAWMVANVTGGLLLTTSNRSEATLGYCTMDGDTSGGLAPLGGIDKALLRRFLVWLQRDGITIGGTRHHFPDLAIVTQQEPTAELLPPTAKQTDENDLMPYTLLQRLEQWVIGEHLRSVDEIVHRLQDEPLCATWLEGVPRERDQAATQLTTWVHRFLRLWQTNQWKRCRYANAFAIDGHAPSNEDFADYPILSGDDDF